jgi:membrane associated rhomboid family serine protease
MKGYKDYVIFYLSWLIITVGAYVSIPDAIETLGLQGSKALQGEFLRIFVFPFIHLSNLHMIENLAVLFVLILIAIHLDLKFRHFLGIFLIANFLVGILGSVIWPYKIIVGSSIGLFALFGALAMKAKAYLSPKWSISIFLVLMGLNVVYKLYAGESIIQEVYHSAGLLVGIGLVVRGHVLNTVRAKRKNKK